MSRICAYKSAMFCATRNFLRFTLNESCCGHFSCKIFLVPNRKRIEWSSRPVATTILFVFTSFRLLSTGRDVTGCEFLSVDRKSGGEAKRGRSILSLGRGSDDAREVTSVEASGRGGIGFLQTTTSRAARGAGPSEGPDGVTCLSDVRREAVLGAAVGGRGRA